MQQQVQLWIRVIWWEILQLFLQTSGSQRCLCQLRNYCTHLCKVMQTQAKNCCFYCGFKRDITKDGIGPIFLGQGREVAHYKVRTSVSTFYFGTTKHRVLNCSASGTAILWNEHRAPHRAPCGATRCGTGAVRVETLVAAHIYQVQSRPAFTRRSPGPLKDLTYI